MVVLGVDPHKKTHTLVAAGGNGQQSKTKTVKAPRSGHLDAWRWAAQLEDRLWAGEDCRHLAGAPVRDLIAAGEEVDQRAGAGDHRLGGPARARGKSDPTDALAVARGALRELDLQRAMLDEDGLQVGLLLDHREDLVAERTRAIQRLRWHLVDLDPDLEPGARSLDRLRVLHHLGERLASLEPATTIPRQRRDLAVEPVERVTADTTRINEPEREITALVVPLAPALLQIPGVGALTAATLPGEVAGICRFRTSARLANLAGTACIPVWTGNNPKYRLNRGGNTQPNTALHRIAVTQIRIHPPAKALYQRRLKEHRDTKAGALRVLKRHLVDVVFQAMNQDNNTRRAIAPPLPAAAA